jgi:superfamily I DNA/RNA helicase
VGQDFELSPEQQAIVEHHPGQHARVLAGPGTGKSFTAMVWLGHLVERHDGIRAKLLTFTRAATAEFAEKLRSGGLEGVIDAPQTVHARALSVLVAIRGEDYEPALDLLLVDEYQDLNRADIRFVTELSELGVTIIAIGDDDQSIYGWRHAAPEGIRGFLAAFTTDASYPLTISRRCGSNILDAARELIETAPDRAAKPALSSPDDATDGVFAYIRFRTTDDEANGVARIVAQRVAEGVPAEEILLLARSSVDVWFRVLEPEFEARGLAISSVAWVDDALTEPALRRMIALGRLAENGEDSLAWWALTITLNERVGPAFDAYVQERRTPDETCEARFCGSTKPGFLTWRRGRSSASPPSSRRSQRYSTSWTWVRNSKPAVGAGG